MKNKNDYTEWFKIASITFKSLSTSDTSLLPIKSIKINYHQVQLPVI